MAYVVVLLSALKAVGREAHSNACANTGHVRLLEVVLQFDPGDVWHQLTDHRIFLADLFLAADRPTRGRAAPLRAERAAFIDGSTCHRGTCECR
jgi:hypothetical protein